MASLCDYLCCLMSRPSPSCTLFPYTTLFRSRGCALTIRCSICTHSSASSRAMLATLPWASCRKFVDEQKVRSEEHTSELQSRFDLVCRLLLEKKKRLHARRSWSTTRSCSCDC